MMSWYGGGFSIFGSILYLVVFIDLVLLGMWLWKQVNKK